MTNFSREARIGAELITEMGVDLTDLTVLTEAASGPYLTTPLIAALAGAQVLAVTRDSQWATGADVRHETLALAADWGVEDRVQISIGPKPHDWLARADIVTNSGHVRPITRADIAALRPTAVIALMWETWEFRTEDLDLDACREQSVLVLGTCESVWPCDMVGYSPAIALKLLFSLGLEGYGTRAIVLGGQATLGAAIATGLVQNGAQVAWFTEDGGEGAMRYAELESFFEAGGARYDAIIVAEHGSPALLLGHGGALEISTILRVNPGIRVGVISGNVDAAALSGGPLLVLPERLQPPGFMSYQASDLGPRPVLHLYVAGLRVGQAMARARLAGLPVTEAARVALDEAPAMDFAPPLNWA